MQASTRAGTNAEGGKRKAAGTGAMSPASSIFRIDSSGEFKTKAASDIYIPISGEITDGNQSVVDNPSAVNKDPEGSAWFFKMKIKNKSDLDS
ncbi:MAG: hypothetical protein CMO43_11865, partial [Verrucomicrobiales bacterium]|nr:hypothetical protein [Verrucomicrobiales bacterium]